MGATQPVSSDSSVHLLLRCVNGLIPTPPLAAPTSLLLPSLLTRIVCFLAIALALQHPDPSQPQHHWPGGGEHAVQPAIHTTCLHLFSTPQSCPCCTCSPNTIGQVVVSTLCNPPKPGDPSYELFAKERADELASLRRRANLVSSAFNSLPNMSVVPTEAAMYSFPQVCAVCKHLLTPLEVAGV
jgi:hypothetical protein